MPNDDSGQETGLPEGVRLVRLEGTGPGYLDPGIMERFGSQLASAAAQPPRLLLVAGPRKGLFGLGLDLGALRQPDGLGEAYLKPLQSSGAEAIQQLISFPAPTVACIDGPGVGASLTVALACDTRCATSHDRTVLGFPEPGLGLLPVLGGVPLLCRLTGPVRAVEVLSGGRRIRAAAARTLGLVDAIVDPENGLAAAAHRAMSKLDSLHHLRRRPRRYPQGRTWLDLWIERTRIGRRLLFRRLEAKLNESRIPGHVVADILPGLQDGLELPLEESVVRATLRAREVAGREGAAEMLDQVLSSRTKSGWEPSPSEHKST
jgi:enoyl-CoA hydratase/carnithine racemase